MRREPGIRPVPSLARRLDGAARRGFPLATTIILLLGSGAPLDLPAQAELQIGVALCCVFFWSVYRPASMPPAAVFLIGVLVDLLGFGPLGINAVVLLACHGAASRWRRELTRGGFLLAWLVFVAVAAASSALGWALVCLQGLSLYPTAPAALQAGLSAGIYPGIAVLLARAHRTLAEPALA